jgi:Ca-activated chloride channel family protein
MAEDLGPEVMPVDGDALSDALLLAETMLTRAGVPGSVLVMTDAVSASQVAALEALPPSVPVQFLALSSASQPLEMGLEHVASKLGAALSRLTVDDLDIRRAAGRAASDYQTVSSSAGEVTRERWRDAGYMLLAPIALLGLMWSRRGWMVR